MKTLVSLLAICLVTAQVRAKEPTKTNYGRLLVEQLAMRFRYPDRYMNMDKGEAAPMDMAFSEMVRRGLIRVGTAKTDVELLLGPPEFPGEKGVTRQAATDMNFGMLGGTLVIVLDKDGTVLEALIHHDGDADAAHIEPIKLKPRAPAQNAVSTPN